MTDATISFATNRDPVMRASKVVGFGERFHPNLDELRFGRGYVTFSARDEARFTSAIAVRDFVHAHAPRLDVYPESQDARVLGSSALFEKLRELMCESKDTLVFLHGYNQTFHEALAIAYGLQWHLRTRFAARPINVTAFSWPSDGRITPWVAYRADRLDARTSGPAVARAFLKLRDYLAAVEEPCRGRIHLLAHSMGCFVLERALQEMVRLFGVRTLPRLFDEVILAAADVDADAFEHDDKLARLPELARRVTAYVHPLDLALHVSDRTKANVDRLGNGGPSNSRRVPDKVDIVDCTAVSSDITNHCYYIEPRLLEDLSLVLAGTPSESFPGGKRDYVDRLRRFILRA